MIVGITGHRYFDSEETGYWVQAQLADLVTMPELSLGVTNLAIGSDQWFAQSLLMQGLPFRAILPCRQYAATFLDSEFPVYQDLLDQASELEVLDFEAPDNDAFLAGGQRIAEVCELLIAVWDGAPAKGKGGTAEVVAYARELGRPLIWVNPGVGVRTVRHVSPSDALFEDMPGGIPDGIGTGGPGRTNRTGRTGRTRRSGGTNRSGGTGSSE